MEIQQTLSITQKIVPSRDSLIRRIYSDFANQKCFSLVGTHCLGKSFILTHICKAEVRQQVEFDFSDSLQKTREEFLNSVIKQTIMQSNKLLQVVRLVESDEDKFSAILDQVHSQRFMLVLLMNAFGNVRLNNRFDSECFFFLCRLATDGKLIYVVASAIPLYKVCHRGDKDSPFFNIFTAFYLGSFKLAETLDLVGYFVASHYCPLTEK